MLSIGSKTYVKLAHGLRCQVSGVGFQQYMDSRFQDKRLFLKPEAAGGGQALTPETNFPPDP